MLICYFQYLISKMLSDINVALLFFLFFFYLYFDTLLSLYCKRHVHSISKLLMKQQRTVLCCDCYQEHNIVTVRCHVVLHGPYT